MTEKQELPASLFLKIQGIKCELMEMNLKKSGKNSHAGFEYYELADILPAIVKLCYQYKVFSRIVFNNENAVLELVNIENPTETAVYTSPMRDVELKGCQPIQALGAVETYQRRYLMLNAFDIVENDTLDAVAGDEKKQPAKKETKWFNKEQLQNLSNNTEYLKKFTTSDDLIKDIQKLGYSISKEMKMHIADVRADIE